MFHGIPTYMWHLSTCKKHKQILKYYNPSESKIRRHCWVTIQVRAMLGTSHVESSIEWKGSIRIANWSSKNLQPKIKHVCKIADVETFLLIRYSIFQTRPPFLWCPFTPVPPHCQFHGPKDMAARRAAASICSPSVMSTFTLTKKRWTKDKALISCIRSQPVT